MHDSEPGGLHVAILAAGPGERFGSSKALARIDRGRPVLGQVLSRAVGVGGHSTSVILGAHARDVADAMRESGASVVLNRDWEEGIASSIRAAVRALPPATEALMLLLVDQVGVTAYDLARLRAGWRRQPTQLVTALCGGRACLPAVFPSWAFSELLGLRGDRGPEQLLRRHADRALRVPMPNASKDLDTPEDLLFLGPDDDTAG
jgi:CTP:molybdopterin cytidylyltransferase MocA